MSVFAMSDSPATGNTHDGWAAVRRPARALALSGTPPTRSRKKQAAP